MAISTVRVKINGVWTNLTLNSDTGEYEGTITAPAVTSYNQSGHYYPVTIEVTNDAGTVVVKDSTDEALGDLLQLVVKERIKPVITLESPSDGAYVQNNVTPIVFTVADETNGSGVKEDTIVLKVDDNIVSLTKTSISDGYRCTYTPAFPIEDGRHTINISAQDNDGNVAEEIDASYTIDTIPPTLTLTSPTKKITNQPSCTVSGVTNDESSSPVSVTITLNDDIYVSAEIDAAGNFSEDFTLSEGDNNIVVVSTDRSGRSTSIAKTIKLDTTIPQITGIIFEPNPVDVSQLVRITLQVQ